MNKHSIAKERLVEKWMLDALKKKILNNNNNNKSKRKGNIYLKKSSC